MNNPIPLLSGRPLVAFTPSEFKAHVRSLYHKKEPRKAAPKVKSPFKWSRTKTGKLSIKVSRDPKSLTDTEMSQIARESTTPLNEIFLYMKKKKITLTR